MAQQLRLVALWVIYVGNQRVSPAGLERASLGFETVRSIQLSYGDIL